MYVKKHWTVETLKKLSLKFDKTGFDLQKSFNTTLNFALTKGK